jgi:hypothetical protein
MVQNTKLFKSKDWGMHAQSSNKEIGGDRGRILQRGYEGNLDVDKKKKESQITVTD